MKFKTLAVATGVSAPLILTGSASADFVGITVVLKDITGFEDFVAKVVNLYAMFSDDDGDGIGDGLIFVCAGISGQPLNICVRDGVFYQHSLGEDTAPLQVLVDVFPALAVDTFVTIGVKTEGVEGDETALSIPWPGFGPDCLSLGENGGWFVTPVDPQGRPGNFDNPPTAVLIGQFSVAAGAGPNAGVFGDLVISGFHGDGRSFQEYLSFDSQVPRPELIWFNNQADFEAFNAGEGNVLKGIEDFEESILGSSQVVNLDDPLESHVPNSPDGFPFPEGLTGLPNLIVQSNNLGGNPTVPDPQGVGGLAAASAGIFV